MINRTIRTMTVDTPKKLAVVQFLDKVVSFSVYSLFAALLDVPLAKAIMIGLLVEATVSFVIVALFDFLRRR